jgi:hypothetical protein
MVTEPLLPLFYPPVTLVDVKIFSPYFYKIFKNALETSTSAPGITLSINSTTVTSVPNL